MIRDRAIARVKLIETMVRESDRLFELGDYVGAADYANSAGDSAEAACAAFDGMADCLRGAMNAHPNECERWEGYAENAAKWVNAAEKRYADCINLVGK